MKADTVLVYVLLFIQIVDRLILLFTHLLVLIPLFTILLNEIFHNKSVFVADTFYRCWVCYQFIQSDLDLTCLSVIGFSLLWFNFLVYRSVFRTFVLQI